RARLSLIPLSGSGYRRFATGRDFDSRRRIPPAGDFARTRSMNTDRRPLTDDERAIYEWQIWVSDFGEAGQESLKGASVLVSRVGGLGSVVAYQLAAAGVGKLVLAHAGNVKPSDLNRQLLMTHDWLGKPR